MNILKIKRSKIVYNVLLIQMFKIIIIFVAISLANAYQNNLCVYSNGNCTYCSVSYSYLSNNSCFLCPIECATCSSTQKCLTCRLNYYLSNASCILCPQNCQVCSPICSQCMDGFALVNNKCIACADSNAQTCQTPTTIIACKAGFWSNGNSCSPCRQFCLQCSSSSNCFSCQDGYQVAVSFGSYCSSCPSGCKTCSSSVCTQCLYNFQLSNGNCISIAQSCKKIPHCSKCIFANSSVACHTCFYPYFLRNSQCIIGSSMLCQNGSVGSMFFQCINNCYFFGYKINSYQNGMICQPNSWINSNYQYYLNPYSFIFSNLLVTTLDEIIAYDISDNGNSLLTFSITLNPYYKIDAYFKMIAVNQINQNLTINYVISDNRSNIYSKSFNKFLTTDYEPFYHNFTTKIIQDQLVYFNISIQQNLTNLPIIGLSELIIQVYSCPTNCRLCYNKQLCIECYGGYFNTPDNTCVTSCSGYIQIYYPNGNPLNYTSKSCVLQCSSQFYTSQNASQYICVKCNGNCITCLSDSQCLSCINPLLYYEINYTCLNSCPFTHYNSNKICTPCIAPCETCIDSIMCLTCSVGYLKQNKCESICPLGTYQNNLNNTCSLCSQKCTSCIISPTYCLSCNSPYILSDSSCVLNCSSSLYFQRNRTCEPCVIPCRRCKSQAQCLSCSVGYLYGYKCLNQCLNGFYADSFNAECKACENECLTCMSSIICLSCPNTTNLYSYSCYSTCPANTYPSANICFNCLLPCGNCQNQTFCTSCSIGYLSQATLGSCVSSCESGFYGFALNRSCLSCTNNCSTCSVTSFLCTSCQSNLLLQNSACVQSCATGLFNLSGTCYTCTYPCLNCVNTDYNCMSCYTSFILINNTCQTQCPINTFLNENFCYPCQYPCDSCFSDIGCVTCALNSTNQTFLYDSECLNQCPSTTFADASSFICRSCLYPCENCISQQICVSCASGYLDISSGACTICSDTTFANDTSRQCQKCSSSMPNCLICISSTQCTRCANNFYLFNSTCVTSNSCLNYQHFYVDSLLQSCEKCVSPCKSCLNQSYCLSCFSGNLLNGNCLLYCPKDYYQSSNFCLKCLFPCLTCSSDSQCLTCNNTSLFCVLLVVKSTCIQSSQCPSGFYLTKNINQFQCLKCPLPCLTCANSTFCQSCFSGILINGSCKALCPSMYYAQISKDNVTVCSECSSNCFKCTKSADYCTSCFEGVYMRNNTCVNNCGNGYFLDQTVLQCFSCLNPCGNCSSISTCLDCINSSYILYYGQCLTSCPDGSYSNSSTCYPCPTSCMTCKYIQISNTVRCSSCSLGLFMSSQQQGLCVSNCSSIQYGDIITRTCYNCIAPCLSCVNAISCLSCQPDYLLYKRQCLKVSRCPALSYLLNKSCIDNCGDLWASPSSALCIHQCNPLFLKVYQNNSKNCLSQCPKNFKVDENYTCLSCIDGKCSNLLHFQLQYKNIFNILYLKLTFNKQIQGNLLKNSHLSISVSQNFQQRVLSQQYTNFSIGQINLNAIWIQLSLNQTLRSATITLTFNDFYIFSQTLQSLNYNIIVRQFDYYTADEKSSADGFQRYSEVMSIVMALLFILNLCLNSGHLSYSIIDYYQLLFMVLFLSIDFPPQLNHFLYGFRYSHYLFLPQIFRGNAQDTYTTSTPDQFGVIVPDVNFINNTGHDFIIIFTTVSVLIFCKVAQILLEKIQCFRSNKVREQNENDPSVLQQPQKQQNQSLFSRFVKAVICRFKWNYFNDINYTIYFSIMLFAFSQLYDLQWKSATTLDLISILLAFFFLILGIFFPFFLIWFLRKNEKNLIQNSLEKEKQDYQTNKRKEISVKVKNDRQFQKQIKQNSLKRQSVHNEQKNSYIYAEMASNSSQNDQQTNKFQILTDYKCFLSGIKLKVRLGFYQIPIRFIKKLILAALLVYCSQYPSFALGVIMMLCFINILITIVLKPFRLTFQQILSPIFDGLYFIIFFIICVMQLPLLDLTKAQKLTASYAAISLCTILSLLLAIYNIVMNVVEVIKYFWKIDYFKKYYQKQYVTASDESDHVTDQGTNVPLKKQQPGEVQQMTGTQIFSGLDIYLKKQSTAPKYLIKCIKQEQDQGQRSQNNTDAVGYTEGPESIRQSHEILSNARRSSQDFIFQQRNRQAFQKLVKGIKAIQFSQQDQSNQSDSK